MKYQSTNHPKVRSMPLHFQEVTYPLLKLTQINIEYNGGVKLHNQYKNTITELQQATQAKSKYGAQLFTYMVELCRSRKATGFKVSLDNHLFTKKKGSKANVSFTSWVNTLEYAVSQGYGKLYIGDSHKTEGKVEYVSVFELTPKAFTLVEEKSPVNAPNASFTVDKKNAVITTIKTSKGRYTTEEEVATAGVREKKNFVNEANAHNLKFTFATGEGLIFDPQVYRKYSLYADTKKNNGLTMFESYGRFVGQFQSMSPLDRSRITIDGEATVEGDYSSNHAFIAYEKLGITCEESFKPYLVAQNILNVTDEEARSIFKIAMMMMFNAKRPEQALHEWVSNIKAGIERGKSVRSLDWKGVELPDYQQCKAICKVIAEHNTAISEFFGGYANLLQNIDSNIAENVMRILMTKGIPFLCIHDSFIVPTTKSGVLEDAMKEAWKIVLGSNNNCRVDFKTFNKEEEQQPTPVTGHLDTIVPLSMYQEYDYTVTNTAPVEDCTRRHPPVSMPSYQEEELASQTHCYSDYMDSIEELLEGEGLPF